MSKNPNQEIPKWKQDFPLEQKEATHVSRREFAKFLTLLSGALAVGSTAIVVKSLAFPDQPLVGEHPICLESDVPLGESYMFEIEGSKTIPYLLINLGEGEWRAFEQKCTHLSCAVKYRHDLGQIECPCHKGYFNPRTGDVIQGPPPRPLPQLEVVLRDGMVLVKAQQV
ncbi:QcrA and Rieske domain-containing protein [Algoriphagus namhaensis]